MIVVKSLHQLRLRYIENLAKNESSPYPLMKDFSHVLLLVLGLRRSGGVLGNPTTSLGGTRPVSEGSPDETPRIERLGLYLHRETDEVGIGRKVVLCLPAPSNFLDKKRFPAKCL